MKNVPFDYDEYVKEPSRLRHKHGKLVFHEPAGDGRVCFMLEGGKQYGKYINGLWACAHYFELTPKPRDAGLEVLREKLRVEKRAGDELFIQFQDLSTKYLELRDQDLGVVFREMSAKYYRLKQVAKMIEAELSEVLDANG